MRQITPRRGRPPSITRERIVERALVRLDEAGVDGLTMKELAGDLGVTTMALYRHVNDKENLLALALDAIAEPFAAITFSQTMPPSWPALLAIAVSGARQARVTIL